MQRFVFLLLLAAPGAAKRRKTGAPSIHRQREVERELLWCEKRYTMQ